MKKLLTIIAVLFSLASFGQEVKQPNQRPFVALGTTYSSVTLPVSVEVGKWGIASPLSYSLSVDYYHYNKSYQELWAGPKLYYTVYNNDEYKVCYMLYMSPKIDLKNTDNQLLEFGFNPNYMLTDDLLLGVTFGNTAYRTSQLNLFMSVGFVYLF